MYDPPLISIINRFDLSIHQSLMKISGVPVTFHGLFSHKLKNKRVSFIRSSRVNRMSQEERSLWNNKIFKRGLIHFKFSFPLPMSVQFSSVQFSLSVVSDSLRPHGLQHTRPPCPSPTPGVYSNSCPLRW